MPDRHRLEAVSVGAAPAPLMRAIVALRVTVLAAAGCASGTDTADRAGTAEPVEDITTATASRPADDTRADPERVGYERSPRSSDCCGPRS